MAEQTDSALVPNTVDMRTHLHFLFGGAREYDDGLIEIAAGKDGKWHSRLFGTDQIDQAVQYAAHENIRGWNVYNGQSLRDPDSPPFGRSSDADHYATTAAYVDLDTSEAAAAAPERTASMRPHLAVCTGIHPHRRMQLHWLLNEPLTDKDAHRAVCEGLADSLGGDRHVCNPGRILRLAGSIAWPTKPGRTAEMTFLLNLKEVPPPVSIVQLQRQYPRATNATTMDTGKNTPIERVATGTLGLGAEQIADGRESYMRDTILAVLIEFIGEHGAVPNEQELFDAAWPQYEAHVDLSRPGRNRDEMARKIVSTLRRFERGQLRGLPDMDAIVERYKAKKKAEGKREKPKKERASAGEQGASGDGASGSERDKTDKAERKIKTVSYRDLLRDTTPEEPDYIEPNFLGPGNFCLIAGPPKAQKSLLLNEILVACATGRPFLAGQFTVPKPLKIFYLQAEMNRKLLRKRARMMGGLTDETERLLGENLMVTERFHMLLNEEGVAAAVEAIREVFPEGPDIIAIDPLANIFDGESEDKAAEVMQFLTQRVEAVRRQTNPRAAIILVHHSTKKTSADMGMDPFIYIRGSGALRGYYDTGIVIFRKSEDGPERKIHFELRNGESPEPITARLGADGVFEVIDTTVDGISRQTAIAMLEEVAARWRSGKPLSVAPQTRREGRHAPTVLASKFEARAEAVSKLLEQWLMNGICEVSMTSTDSKLKGLKVVQKID